MREGGVARFHDNMIENLATSSGNSIEFGQKTNKYHMNEKINEKWKFDHVHMILTFWATFTEPCHSSSVVYVQ